MSNEYHILSFRPAIDAVDMPPVLEQLAQQLVRSGKLRIHADTVRNFVPYSGPDFDKTFSWRELNDPALYTRTRERIAQTIPPAHGEAGIDEVVERLRSKIPPSKQVEEKREMQIARLVVQAAHPAVMQLLLIEQVDVFVSYSHTVGDLMAMHFWEDVGQSGGLQSISGDGTAVYVSCAGNPFVSGDNKTHTTDGFPAMARLLVIAGQELGHYADILRNARGQLVGRHSATLGPLRAKPEMRQNREQDLQHVQALMQQMHRCGIYRLARFEKAKHFFAEKRKGSPIWLWYFTLTLLWRALVGLHRLRLRSHFIGQFPTRLYPSTDLGTNMSLCVADMLFNLAPDADAYRRPDPREEEAIICIEALARVPQQAVKWGHATTRAAWPKLYVMYYGQVIEANKHAIAQRTGRVYELKLQPARWGMRRIWHFLRYYRQNKRYFRNK
ncbi:MAG: hypothetical protein CMM94_08735 [Rickettsiales bacterium]|nr:hypothetical protein [Rickettsiales bacterium]